MAKVRQRVQFTQRSNLAPGVQRELQGFLHGASHGVQALQPVNRRTYLAQRLAGAPPAQQDILRRILYADDTNHFNGLVRAVRDLEMSCTKKALRRREAIVISNEVFGELYELVGRQGIKAKQYVEAVEFGVKIFTVRATRNFESAFAILSIILKEYERLGGETQSRINRHLLPLVTRDLARVIPRLDIYELQLRFAYLQQVYPHRYLREKIDMAERLFELYAEPHGKRLAAVAYLDNAWKAQRFMGKEGLDAARVRKMAEYILDNHAGALQRAFMTDTEELAALEAGQAMVGLEGGFETFVVFLGAFGFVDLQKRALLIRMPLLDEPVLVYARLCELETVPLRQTESAYREACRLYSKGGITLDTEKEISETIADQIGAQITKISRRYFESLFQQRGLRSVGALNQHAPQLEYAVQYKPAQEFPRIMELISRMKKKILTYAHRSIADGNQFACITNVVTLSASPAVDARVVFINIPHSEAVEVYVCLEVDGIQDAHVIKFKFRKTTKGLGSYPEFADETIIEGINFKHRSSIPLWVEVYALRALEYTLLAKLSDNLDVYCTELAETDRQIIGQIATADFIEQNRSALESMQAGFEQGPLPRAFEDVGAQVDLSSRLRTARDIVRNTIPEVVSGNAPVDELDILYELGDSVDIIETGELRRIMATLSPSDAALFPRPNGSNRLPMGVIYRPRKGNDVFGVFDTFDRVSILGASRNGHIFDRLLTELALQSVVKVAMPGVSRRARSYSRSRTDGFAGHGFEANVTEVLQPGLRYLDEIYATRFYEEVREDGLWGRPWFMQDVEGYFMPVIDPIASLAEREIDAAKERALIQYGRSGIFVAVGRGRGSLRRLRLRGRKTRHGREWNPESPTSRQLEQQNLMGDNQALPTHWGLFVITSLSDGRAIAAKVTSRPTENEVWGLIDEETARLDNGEFRNEEWLLAQVPDDGRRDALRDDFRSGKVSISAQTMDVNEINHTYVLPRLVPISELLEREDLGIQLRKEP
ncbi:MAG: hypothetical protein KKB81_08305 [Candidatus Margulisbacteria bacterium]|nr:hypothetical protein [Candidatus Margulisiibacteriota bacterium]MBU1021702.1 hypothetical protein [Candidatus Margulisiibacteriota bacterium]MBU1729448.1 hypothetical protein [Candidatus Margulisiibacteriota bacterium]MBU1955451.1 hypothetical protein [Candidatus Margulisiibacteriota bacterium]